MHGESTTGMAIFIDLVSQCSFWKLYESMKYFRKTGINKTC